MCPCIDVCLFVRMLCLGRLRVFVFFVLASVVYINVCMFCVCCVCLVFCCVLFCLRVLCCPLLYCCSFVSGVFICVCIYLLLHVYDFACFFVVALLGVRFVLGLILSFCFWCVECACFLVSVVVAVFSCVVVLCFPCFDVRVCLCACFVSFVGVCVFCFVICC